MSSPQNTAKQQFPFLIRSLLTTKWVRDTNCADQGHDEAGRLTLLVQAEHPIQESCKKRTCYSQGHGDEDRSGVFAGHD